jgi:hypothetical protein
VALLALTGCSFYFNPADSAPELLRYEGFDGNINDGDWYSGTQTGRAPEAEFTNGRLDIRGPRHFLTTNDKYSTDITVLLEWSVLNGNDGQAHPAENTEYPDYSVSLDDAGLTVHFLLYQKLATGSREDRLELVNAEGEVAASAVVVSALRTSGTLRIRFIKTFNQYTVAAAVPELELIMAAEVEGTFANRSHVTIEASGLPDDPRSLDELYLLRERLDLGALM